MKNPLVFDGHNDTLLRLYQHEQDADKDTVDFFSRNDAGHLDVPRAREGGFGGGFFAIFIPNDESMKESDREVTDNGYQFPLAEPIETGHAREMSLAVIEHTLRLEQQAEGRFRVVRRVNELRESLENGTMAAIIHFEGAEALGESPDSLDEFYQLGLRSIGIVWSRPNAFATGVPFAFPATPDIGPGLTNAGKDLVRACNELGVLIDLSHLNEQGFWDIQKLSSHPLVATHSCVHALAPVPRNLTDRQLDAIADSNGIVGVNFAVPFLRDDGKTDADLPVTTLTRHINYVAERLGVDHVALGSDFDGAPVPKSIGDVTGLPRIFDTLREEGWNEADLKKLAHDNWLRILSDTWSR